MKKIITIYICLIALHLSATAGNDATDNLQVCRDVAMSLFVDYLQGEKKDLPDVFGEMPTLLEMVSNKPYAIKLVNSLALIPNWPVIQSDRAISTARHGHRLFAIGRLENFDYAKHDDQGQAMGSGRYSILISPNGLDAVAGWIPENEVQIIFKQIGGFDPAKQPLAFENVEQLERNKKARQDQSTQEIREHLRKTGKLGSDDQIIPSAQHSKRRDFHTLAWIAGGFMIVAFLVWIALRSRTHR